MHLILGIILAILFVSVLVYYEGNVLTSFRDRQLQKHWMSMDEYYKLS